MKRSGIIVLFAFCTIGGSNLVALPTDVTLSALVHEASSTQGDAYRRVVASIQEISGASDSLGFLLDAAKVPAEDQLIGRVLLARLTNEDVFVEYESIIASFREQQQSSRPYGRRSGHLSGLLYSFATAGPESKTVSVRTGTTQIGNIRSPVYREVPKYTDEEIRAGTLRNAAARLAILEHFMKFTVEGSIYEQCELVHVLMRLWSPKSHEMRADDIPIYSLLEAVALNESRHPAVRVAAMTHLPTEMRTAERDLMLTVIKSPATSDELLNHRVVRQSISYFKQHDLELLKDLQTDTYWKQVLINEAIGLPVPAPPKSHSNDEVQIDINE